MKKKIKINIASSALSKKIKDSVTLLQTMCRGKTVELCYSGGKDSDVILELAKMAGIRFRAIYKNTTIDPPGTIRHSFTLFSKKASRLVEHAFAVMF